MVLIKKRPFVLSQRCFVIRHISLSCFKAGGPSFSCCRHLRALIHIVLENLGNYPAVFVSGFALNHHLMPQHTQF